MNGSRARGISNGTGSDDTVSSRAALFEDEKRRIIESCFTKREPDGTFAESYITHIRVTEDATSPSSPPPPNSAPDNKKSRAIIVAVKRSGRVRLHKARENPQGTFSIGKTWVLDDLSAIESYTGIQPTTYEEREQKEWAGDTGVLLTIQKPYFWQIATQKEKDFFVGSLIKIYRKYTKGREPQLTGFTNQELTGFGIAGQPAPLIAAQRSPVPAEPSPYASPSPAASAAQSPYTERSRTRDLRPPSSVPSTPLQTGGSNYMRSPSSNSRPDDGSTRFQRFRSASPGNSTPIDSHASTLRDGRDANAASKFPFESGKESLIQHNTPGNSLGSERSKPNGGFAQFGRTRENIGFGRPPDSPRRVPSNENTFVTRPRSLERRPGAAVRKPSGSEEAKDFPPERRRPPLSSPDVSSAPMSEPPSEPLPPAPQPVKLQTKQPDQPEAAATAFSEAGKKLKQLETSPVPNSALATGGDGASDDIPNIRNISQALASPVDSIASAIQSPEEHRPGLGPMIRNKKSAKEVAATFRKAASAANAFKPRAGGAADRLLRDEAIKSPDATGGDGITGVFVARPKDAPKPIEPTPQPIPEPSVTQSGKAKEPPKATSTIAEHKSASDGIVPQPLSIPNLSEKLSQPAEVKTTAEIRKPLPDRSAYYAKMFGCNPALLEGRTVGIDSVLDDFGWNANVAEGGARKTVEELTGDIKKDLAKLETGSWISVMDSSSERVTQVSKMIDDAIAECEEFDGLLTLYSVELSTLNEDVAYIEAQSQGLQVQTANQRLLQIELKNLLDTITIPQEQLEVLERSTHEDQNSLKEIGGALVHLYKAMLTIDPSLRRDKDQDVANGIGADVSNMRAVRDQRERYSIASMRFVITFNEKMAAKFQSGQRMIQDTLMTLRSQPAPGTKIDHNIRSKLRKDLLHYSPIVLFEREVRIDEHGALLERYCRLATDPYRAEFKSVTQAWQKETKITSGSDEVLFSTQEKEPEGMARKLTVKRSKTVMRSDGPKGLGIERDHTGKNEPYIAFNGALIDLSEAIMYEQNFITEFFHLHSSQDVDFPDLVEKAATGAEIHTNLTEPRGYESNRDLAKTIKISIGQIFPDWERTLRATIDQIINDDILNAFGILFSIQHRAMVLLGTSQEYLMSTLAQVEEYLDKRINDLIKDQVKAIDDQKVKLKKRKGVLGFIRIFPLFVKAIEVQLPGVQANTLRIRKTIDDHYATINTHIFQSLKAIAKDSGISGMGTQKPHNLQGATDAEDKEILNYHILLIENTHHYLEDVPEGTNYALDAGREVARKEMNEHLDLYVSAILRRPLGKLLDFVESTENLIKAANDGAASIANRASHSKSVFKRILSSYDSREITKGIEALKKRVNKHFAEADEAVISQTLIAKVLKECSERYIQLHDRTSAVISDVYEGSLEVEFKRDDVNMAFKRV